MQHGGCVLGRVCASGQKARSSDWFLLAISGIGSKSKRKAADGAEGTVEGGESSARLLVHGEYPKMAASTTSAATTTKTAILST